MDQIQDISSFFLWEDSADSSEVDNLLLSQDPNYDLESAMNDHQDDARSCSYDDDDDYAADFQDDNRDHQPVGLIGEGRPDKLDGRRQNGAVLVYDSDEEDEEDEESSNNVGVIRDMDEMEDKVFWDTCMAEGYP